MYIVQMVSIYGQPEECSEACREILTIMQREATNANRGSAAYSISLLTYLITYLLVCTTSGKKYECTIDQELAYAAA